MSERETPQAIYDRAAEWVARLDRTDGDRAARAELDEWLAGDVRRRGAFFRAQAAWAMLDRASVLRSGRWHDRSGEASRTNWPSRRKMLWASGAVAASIAALVLGVNITPQHSMKIETAIGEIRRVPLSDGSLAAINTQTKLAITLTPEVRRVDLDEGEAWFQVAKNREIPFLVSVGDVRIKAIGTAFSVRRTHGGAQVLVTEGVVEAWSTRGDTGVKRIAAGARAFVGDNTGPAQTLEASVEIDRALAWRSGQLIFEGDTLANAIAEFNRYNRTKLEVADHSLEQEQIVGRFRTNEPEAFARAAGGVLGARLEIGNDRIVLSRN